MHLKACTGRPDIQTQHYGDGDHLAVKTAILTISDFRQKHVAAGFLDPLLMRDRF